ncbi:MAG: hypothetical protein RLZZ373_2377 [Pseudomonadota bacterium]|jgi:hypothetical protein
MADPRVELAVLNNVFWYLGIFRAHSIGCTVNADTWSSPLQALPFHSNLVVLSPTLERARLQTCLDDLQQTKTFRGWSMKDSYGQFDLTAAGFRVLFNARWIWREPAETQPAPPDGDGDIDWFRVRNHAQLLEWEAAWHGDSRNLTADHPAPQFPASLLDSADHAFLAGRRRGGAVVAGCVLNRSPGVVGVSNLFARQMDPNEAWASLVRLAGRLFPGRPLVGYERGDDLVHARHAGFVPLGPLAVWATEA